MRKALITGIAGFAGSHLAEHLLSKKFRVFGFYHPKHSIENLDDFADRLDLFPCDILDGKKVEFYIKKVKPDYVFHLAAFSSPSESFVRAAEVLQNNIVGQLNLLEPLVKIKSKAKILIIGSADEYGNVDPKYLPINEETPFSPQSPYAVSKIAQDMLGLQFFLHYKLNIVRVRPFNHIGSRQSPLFVVSSFASQIAALEAQGGGVLEVGNLETYRDFTDVRDMVNAYFLALESGRAGDVYNIGCGKLVKIAKILKMLLSLSDSDIKVEKEKSRLRQIDIKSIYCDYSKFHKACGWEPKIPLMTTLSDTIEYERRKISQSVKSKSKV